MGVFRKVAGNIKENAAVMGIGENPRATGWNYDKGGSAKIKHMAAGRELPWFNLYDVEPEKWDRADAARRADLWCRTYEDQSWTLLLLGVKVCNAFGIERPEWLGWYRSLSAGLMIAVPHPSGRNRWYNDADNVAKATQLLTLIASGKLPYKHETEESH